MQGAFIGFAGGVAGTVASPVVIVSLNRGLETLSGFASLIITPWWLYAVAVGIATVIGGIGGFVAGWWQFRRPLAARLR